MLVFVFADVIFDKLDSLFSVAGKVARDGSVHLQGVLEDDCDCLSVEQFIIDDEYSFACYLASG